METRPTQRRPRFRSARICLTAGLALPALLLLASPAVTSTSQNKPPRIVNFEGRGSFDQIKQAPEWRDNQSRFAVSQEQAYTGKRSGRADLASNAESTTKYARGIFNVNWQAGKEVWIGAAFYLPPGFHDDVQGHVTIMRWDNWDVFSRGVTGGAFDRTGIMIMASSRRAHLIYMDQEFRKLTPGFAISEGRWHWLEVFQRFDAAAPYSEVWLDGKLKAKSSVANYNYGHAFAIDRVRYGLVETWDSVQSKPLHLWVDRASVSSTRLGPLKR